jgi:hypothetical protein
MEQASRPPPTGRLLSRCQPRSTSDQRSSSLAHASHFWHTVSNGAWFLAVQLQQVEGVEQYVPTARFAREVLEHGQPVGVACDRSPSIRTERTALDDEWIGIQLLYPQRLRLPSDRAAPSAGIRLA